jgi:hypothetical protein
VTDDYDPAKDGHDSYYAAVEAKRKRTIETQAARIKELERADSEYESLCDDLKAAEAHLAVFRAALAEILALDSTRSIWDARGIARAALMHTLAMRHLDPGT